MSDASSPSPKIRYPDWQNEYVAALFEFDGEKLLQRVEAAETAIFNRLQALSRNPESQAERQAIDDALAALRVLLREISLGFLTGKRSEKSRGNIVKQSAGFAE